jgi:hypothetical protein
VHRQKRNCRGKSLYHVFSQGHLYQELLLLHVASCASISISSSILLTSFAYRLLILHHSSLFCSYISAKVLVRTQDCIMNNGKHFQQINWDIWSLLFSNLFLLHQKKNTQHNRYLYSQGRCQNKAAHAVPIAAQLMPTNRVQVKASKEIQQSGQEVFRKHMQSKLHKSTNLKCMSRWVSALGLVLRHCGVQLTSLFRNMS